MTPLWTIILMAVCSVFAALATFFIKLATPKLHRKIKTLLDKHLFIGLVLYGVGVLMSLVALKYGELSVLYPFVGLQYVWTSLLSMKYLDEKMGLMKIMGVVLIIFGLVLIGLGA